MKKALKNTVIQLCIAALVFVSCMAEDYVFNDGYRVGGSVSRNVGTVVLRNTVTGETAAVTGNGSFLFSKMMDDGEIYNIVIDQNPADQTCTVINGSGFIAGNEVNGVGVMCSTISKQAINKDLGTTKHYPEFETPAAAGSIDLSLGVTADVLITMTSSFGSAAAAVSYARLLVDGNPIAQARATTDLTKMYPVTFSNVVTLQPGNHTISPAYSVSTSNMKVDVGINGVITATVLSTVPGYQRYISASTKGATITGAVPGISIPGLNVDTGILSGNKTVVGMLPLLEIRRSFQEIMNIDMMKDAVNFARASVINNPANELTPMTIFAAADFYDNTAHNLSAQCKLVNPVTSMVLESDFPTTISGIVMDTYTAQSGSSGTARTSSLATLTANTAMYSETSSTDIYLSTPSRLLIALTLEYSENDTAGASSWYALALTDDTKIIGEACVANNMVNGSMPVSIISTTTSPVLSGTKVKTYMKTNGSTANGYGARLTVMRLD